MDLASKITAAIMDQITLDGSLVKDKCDDLVRDVLASHEADEYYAAVNRMHDSTTAYMKAGGRVHLNSDFGRHQTPADFDGAHPAASAYMDSELARINDECKAGADERTVQMMSFTEWLKKQVRKDAP